MPAGTDRADDIYVMVWTVSRWAWLTEALIPLVVLFLFGSFAIPLVLLVAAPWLLFLLAELLLMPRTVSIEVDGTVHLRGVLRAWAIPAAELRAIKATWTRPPYLVLSHRRGRVVFPVMRDTPALVEKLRQVHPSVDVLGGGWSWIGR